MVKVNIINSLDDLGLKEGDNIDWDYIFITELVSEDFVNKYRDRLSYKFKPGVTIDFYMYLQSKKHLTRDGKRFLVSNNVQEWEGDYAHYVKRDEHERIMTEIESYMIPNVPPQEQIKMDKQVTDVMSDKKFKE